MAQQAEFGGRGAEEDLLEIRQPTPVFLLGESHGQRSLAGYRPWGRTESNTTERQSRAAVLRLVPDSCLLVGYPEQGWGRAHPQLLMQL